MAINSRNVNTFTNSFMRGFSFIDDINSRKRQEAKLDQRLVEEQEDRRFRRTRLENLDATRAEDRTRRIDAEDRAKDATAVLALGPDATDEELLQFADDPRVANAIAQRRTDIQDQSDLESLVGPRSAGLNSQVTGAAPADQATQPQGDGGLNSQVAELPGPQFQEPQELSSAQLNELADSDPAAAAAQRDEQKQRQQDNLDRFGDPNAVLVQDPNGSGNLITAGQAKQINEKRDRKEGINRVNDEWNMFADIENVAGDSLRAMRPEILTAKYFDERSTIDDDLRNRTDKRIGPAIQASITSQEAVLTEADPVSLEATNARRKLSEAYSLANEIGISYSAPMAAGVDDRGVPLGNPELVQSTIQAGIEGPGPALPTSGAMNKSDMGMLQRGVSGGRVNDRQATAAYRQFKRGRIDLIAYQTYMSTGQLPAATPTLEQFDTDKPIYANYNGRLEMIQAATTGELANTGRNLIDDKGLAHLYKVSAAYNTEDQKNLGPLMANEFAAAMKGNENAALKAGMDLSNVNDLAWVFDRWMKVHAIQEQYNDEIFYKGRFNPDFVQDFGPMHTAIFNPEVDAIDLRSITDFFGEDPVQIQGIPGLDPAKYDEIRAGIPGMEGASNAQIDVEIARQRAAAGQ